MQTSLRRDLASNFESNPRRIQEKKMRPYADVIYKSLWGSDIEIERIERLADYVLDRYFAVDMIITFPNGMILTGQEKFLSSKWASKHSLTVEYMNDPTPNIKGDWFNLASQFYFCGYITKLWDSFSPWVLVNWPNMVLNTISQKIEWHDNANQEDGAKATFKFCDMYLIPNHCVIASSFDGAPPC